MSAMGNTTCGTERGTVAIDFQGGTMEGNRLKIALESKGLSQREFAEKVGISEATVSKYISGMLGSRQKMLIDICKTLNVSADWLLGLDKGRKE